MSGTWCGLGGGDWEIFLRQDYKVKSAYKCLWFNAGLGEEAVLKRVWTVVFKDKAMKSGNFGGSQGAGLELDTGKGSWFYILCV